MKANDPHELLDLWKTSGENTAGSHPPQSVPTPSKNTELLGRGHWLKIIKSVKSSDRQEIAEAYKAALPYVIQDWAHWLLSKPRPKRLPLIEKIAKHHGEEVGEMVKKRLTELHFSKVKKLKTLQAALRP